MLIPLPLVAAQLRLIGGGARFDAVVFVVAVVGLKPLGVGDLGVPQPAVNLKAGVFAAVIQPVANNRASIGTSLVYSALIHIILCLFIEKFNSTQPL